MKYARIAGVLGSLVVGVGCYLVHIDAIVAVVVAFIGLSGILTGIQIEELIKEQTDESI